MSQVYVDEITQSFVSDGNVFLKMGAITGDVDQAGKDIKSNPVTLIIPLTKFESFVENIVSAGDTYKHTEIMVSDIKIGNVNVTEIIGRPLCTSE